MTADGQLEQIRAFIAIAEEQTIDGASRKLHATPDAINGSLAMLEMRLGIELFERSRSRLLLTEHGRELLTGGRGVLSALTRMNDDARRLAEFQPSDVRILVDEICPREEIVGALQSFRIDFPQSKTNIQLATLGKTIDALKDGTVKFGIAATRAAVPAGFVGERLCSVPYVLVAAPRHPLALASRSIERSDVEKHAHIVTVDSTDIAPEFYGLSPRSTWRLERNEVKRSILIDGNGWGGMAFHLVADDIASGRLVKLDVRGVTSDALHLPVWSMSRVGRPLTAEERAIVDRVRSACAVP